MAPKRKRAPTSTKQATNTKKQPTTNDLALVYSKRRHLLGNVTVWPERGINVEPKSYPFLDEACKMRNWGKLFATPKEYHRKTVIDFYVALPDISDSGIVRVGASRVKFSEKVINDFFGLPSLRLETSDDSDDASDVDEYHSIDRKTIDWNVVLDTIGIQGAKWQKGKDGSRSLKKDQVNFKGRIWQQFVNFSLMPSSNLSHFREDRCLLIYALLKDLRVDVGRLISSQIKLASDILMKENSKKDGEKGTGQKRYNIIFPCLITALCSKSGVDVGTEFSWLPPKSSLSNQIIKQMRGEVGRDNVGNAVDPQVGRDGVGNVANAQTPLAPQPPSMTEDEDEPEWFKRYRLAQEAHNKKIVETLEILASHLGVEICTPVHSPSAHDDEDGSHTTSDSGDEDGSHTRDSDDEDGTHTPASNDDDVAGTSGEGDST